MDETEHKLRVGRQALEALEQSGFESKFAGGAVRDRMMRLAPKDFDIATTATPDQIRTVFEQKSARVIATGEDHGTMTVVMKSVSMEVTTLRKDVRTDGRHAQVEFGQSFEEDAERRDFTVNAMFEDRQGAVTDFFDGQGDLKKKLLRFVGDAKKRIQEDYLRIMRYYRFWARLEFHADPDALKAIEEQRDGLQQISQERITSELMEMLSYKNVREPMNHLIKGGVFALILPELEIPLEKTLKQIDECTKITQKSRAISRIALLTSWRLDKKATEKLSERLRLSNEQKAQLLQLTQTKKAIDALGAEPADAMELIDQCEAQGGEDSFDELFAPTWSIAIPSNNLNRLIETENKAKHLRKKAMPITGREVGKEMNIEPSRELGEMLNILKRGFRNRLWQTAPEGFAYLRSKIKT